MGRAQQPDHLLPIGSGPVEASDYRHADEAHCRDLEFPAELLILHHLSPWVDVLPALALLVSVPVALRERR